MKIIASFIMAVLLLSCTEFLEPDVSAAQLALISPADSLYTSNAHITFWWEPHDSAEAYRLQVFYPSIDQFDWVFDTTFTSERVTLSLDPGAYEWRVRIENPATSSPYQGGTFIIDQVLPELPFLTYPLRQDTLRWAQDSLVLRWESYDAPINGVRSPVSDSVYLHAWVNGTVRQTYRFLVEEDAPKQIGLSNVLGQPSVGTTNNYTWQVVSIDPVGNTRRGIAQSFVIRP